MKKEDSYFIIWLAAAGLTVAGVITENVLTALTPPSAQVHIDVQKVRKEIDAAGLTPVEAMYWKEL
jgi:hypothetical protein